jgi:hypothetical protein
VASKRAYWEEQRRLWQETGAISRVTCVLILLAPVVVFFATPLLILRNYGVPKLFVAAVDVPIGLGLTVLAVWGILSGWIVLNGDIAD